MASEIRTLKGTIKAIPLEIYRREGQENASPIKRSVLYLHVVEVGGKLLVSGSCLEGNFNALLSPEVVERAQLREKYTSEEWRSIVQELLLKTAIRGIQAQLDIIARIKTDYIYDEITKELQMEESQDTDLEPPELSLLVTTRGKFPITMGTLFLANIDTLEEEVITEVVDQERNVYNWLELMAAQYSDAAAKESFLELENAKLRLQKDTLLLELDTLAASYERTIADLNDKFLQVLNSKKERIFQLENHQNDPLELLNLRYISDNKMNLDHMVIDRSKIPDKLDSVYLSPPKGAKREGRKRSSGEKKSTRKRVRLVKKEPKNEDDTVSTIALRLRSSMLDHELVRSIIKHEKGDSEDESFSSEDFNDENSGMHNARNSDEEQDNIGGFKEQNEAKMAPSEQETDYDSESDNGAETHRKEPEKDRGSDPSLTGPRSSSPIQPVELDPADNSTDFSDLLG